MAWFSFDAFPNLHWGSQKIGLTFDNFRFLGGFFCTKSFEKFSCSFPQNQYGKFYSQLGIAIKVHLLVNKVW